MRKDSEMFLKKLLEYKQKIGKNNFEVNYNYFKEIPSIDTAVYDILKDLIANNCLTSKSQMIDLEGDISINLTLDGITYFEERKVQNSASVYNINAEQVNIANDNGQISAIQAKHSFEDDLRMKKISADNMFEQKKTEIDELFTLKEYERAYNKLEKLKTYAAEPEEIFWVDFLYGKYYLLLFDENKEKNHLDNAMQYFEKAMKYMELNAKSNYEECHFYILNCYVRISMTYGEVIWYEQGIKYFEKYKQELIEFDIKRNRKYTTILDYALLLVESSSFYDSIKAKENLMKAFALYKIIYDSGEKEKYYVDEETMYRYYANGGRCCQLLAEYKEAEHEEAEEFYVIAIQLYEQLLETGIITLRNPERYGRLYNNLGNIYIAYYNSNPEDIEKVEKSKAYYEKALVAFRNMKDEGKYYECLSNKARVMISLYDLKGGKEQFEEIEKILIETIEKRIQLGKDSGAYISKIQLAQLYTRQKDDEKKLERAIQLYDEALEYYSANYMPDNYLKINVGRFQAQCLLLFLKNDIEKLGREIKDMLECVSKRVYQMSYYVKKLYAHHIATSFFLYTEKEDCINQEDIYEKMKIAFEKMNVDINDYIIIYDRG